jgi:hypothetical protein
MTILDTTDASVDASVAHALDWLRLHWLQIANT